VFLGNNPATLFDPVGAMWGWLESAVETLKELPGVLYEDFASGAAAQRLRSFGAGFVEGTKAAVTGAVHAVTHPVETIESVAQAVLHFDQVIEAFGEQWEILMWQAQHDPDAFAASVGRFIGELEAGMVIGAGAERLKALARMGDMVSDIHRHAGRLRNSYRQTRMHPDPAVLPAPEVCVQAAGPGRQLLKTPHSTGKPRPRGAPRPEPMPPTIKLPRGKFSESVRRAYPVREGMDRRHYFADAAVRRILNHIANIVDDPIRVFNEMNNQRGYGDLPRNDSVYKAARTLQLNIFNDPRNFWIGNAVHNQFLGRVFGEVLRETGHVNLMGRWAYDFGDLLN
jgi:hypothetical protein